MCVNCFLFVLVLETKLLYCLFRISLIYLLYFLVLVIICTVIIFETGQLFYSNENILYFFFPNLKDIKHGN